MKKLLLILLCFPLFGFGQFTDNFSDGDFTNNPNWMGDIGSFEVDTNNKLHLNDSIASTSSLVTQNQSIINGEWIFDVKLDFSPSTNNYARVYLVSDMIDLSGPLNGMYVKIGGQTGSVDDISLYTQSGINHNEIIDGIAGLVTNNPDISVKVTRDAIGNWELFLDTNGVFFTQGTAFDNSIISSNYFGVFCKYTITRNKKFWFDNFSISGSNVQSIVYMVIPTGTATTIDANGIILNAFPATETYVLGDTVSLVPTIDPLYSFSHWETVSNAILPNTFTEQISFYANYSDTIQLHTFLLPPTTAFISGSDTICYNQNIDAEVSIHFNGVTPFTFVYEIDGIAQPTISTSSNPYIILTQQGGIYTLYSFNDANGVGTTSGSAIVFVNTSPIDCPPPLAIQEQTTNKKLLRTIDVLGREVKETKNEPLFYIYNDGTVEKKIIIE